MGVEHVHPVAAGAGDAEGLALALQVGDRGVAPQGGAHPELVVGHQEDDGQAPQRGEVERLAEGALVGGAVAERAERHVVLAAVVARQRDARREDDVTLCTFGDGASNQGTFGETLNLAALWKLPVLFLVTNNQFGMGRPCAVTPRSRTCSARARASASGDALRRDGRPRHPRGRLGGDRARARGPTSGARGGGHLPLPRPFDGRPRGVPHQGGGRAVARARPDPRLRRSARPRGIVDAERRDADRRRGRRAGGGRWRSPRPRRSPLPSPCTTTCTCSASGPGATR